jgi:hypothetical protein
MKNSLLSRGRGYFPVFNNSIIARVEVEAKVEDKKNEAMLRLRRKKGRFQEFPLTSA